MDTENQPCQEADTDSKRSEFIYAGKVPLPLRRKHVVSDILKMVLCLAILVYDHCCTLCLLRLLTGHGTGASVNHIGFSDSARAHTVSQTTTSTVCSVAGILGISRRYGTVTTRTSFTTPVLSRSTHITIPVAYRFSKR
jgi:hypothetical protein